MFSSILTTHAPEKLLDSSSLTHLFNAAQNDNKHPVLGTLEVDWTVSDETLPRVFLGFGNIGAVAAIGIILGTRRSFSWRTLWWRQ
jgi:hypothetical protein